MTTLPFATSNDGIFNHLEPFIVVPPFSRGALDFAPFGLRVEETNVIDPLRLASEPFLSLLQRLDGLTFGPEGMPMPRWVFYDCAELPAAVFGFGRRASLLPPILRELFQIERGYTGLVPMSMYAALPMFRPGEWFGHNLSSIAPVAEKHAPGGPSLKGLGSITKALALKSFRVGRLYGATQWASSSLFIHSKFGPLQLETAYTPAHSEPETLTYVFDVSDEALRATMGDGEVRISRPPPEEWIAAHNVVAMEKLQDRIEEGERLCIPSAPRRESGVNLVPIARI